MKKTLVYIVILFISVLYACSNGTEVVDDNKKLENDDKTMEQKDGNSDEKEDKNQDPITIIYPNLSGYEIKIFYDGNPSDKFVDVFGKSANLEIRKKVLEEIEADYNCKISLFNYISGFTPSSVIDPKTYDEYVLNTDAQFDFIYLRPSFIDYSQNKGIIANLTDIYEKIGKELMPKNIAEVCMYGNNVYAFNLEEPEVDNHLIYNYDLWKELNRIDPSLEEPAKLYLDGKWTMDSFYDYCSKVQKIINDNVKYNDYFCFTGKLFNYFQGFANAQGEITKTFNNNHLSLTNEAQIQTFDYMRKLYNLNRKNKNTNDYYSFEIMWKDGKSLFYGSNKIDHIWNEIANIGFVPFPSNDEYSYCQLAYDNVFAMANNREWAYVEGSDCSKETIAQVLFDYYSRVRNSCIDEHNDLKDLYKNENSIKAIDKLYSNIEERGIYDYSSSTIVWVGRISQPYVKNISEDNIINYYITDDTLRKNILEDYIKKYKEKGYVSSDFYNAYCEGE